MDFVKMATVNDLNRPPSERTPLDRSAWIEAAIELIASEGIAGLRIETLARRLRVTKGSFYWHFRDRRSLQQALLEHWREGRIRDIHKQTRAIPGHEAEQLRHVIDVYSASRNRKGILIELAIREWAQRDPEVAEVVAEVDAIRLACARDLFLALGLSEEEATARATLLYAYVFGFSLMHVERMPQEIERLKTRIAGWITGPAAGDDEGSSERLHAE
jgi:AcrR family transcriptional regulator